MTPNRVSISKSESLSIANYCDSFKSPQIINYKCLDVTHGSADLELIRKQIHDADLLSRVNFVTFNIISALTKIYIKLVHHIGAP